MDKRILGSGGLEVSALGLGGKGFCGWRTLFASESEPSSLALPGLPVGAPRGRAHDPGVADVLARHWLRSASAAASRLFCVLSSSSSSSICFSVEGPS